jgi:aldose 1-epimerase
LIKFVIELTKNKFMELIRDIFGNARKGEKVFLYTLRNDNGIIIKITNYGGIVTSIETPDKNGQKANIVLGFKSFQDYISDFYLANCPYFGCIVGRYANRIAKGKFSIEGKEYTLPVNNGANSLHGGITGFDKVIWAPHEISKPDQVGVELKYRSVHMEEGFPGNLDLTVTYTLNHRNEFQIEYKAVTDRTTVINFTNHTYFNLTGGKENIFNHTLQLCSQTYAINDDGLIPTGEIGDVSGTPLDFTLPAKVGLRINELKDGYDHNYILDNPNGKLVKAAVLTEESSGRMIEAYTTEPAVQLYTGYYIPEMNGSNGEILGRYAGLTLESQHYPDSPNKPEFPTTELHPGEVFKSKTIYKFSS